MVARVHTTSDYVKGNAESCLDLVQYLNKENEGVPELDRECFFNNDLNEISDNKVVQVIDSNKKGLKKDEAKFYMITVNPHEHELQHIAKQVTGRDISSFEQMTISEQKEYNNRIKDYTNNVMEEYAKSFNRGLSKDDVVYFAKVEQKRTYKGWEDKVKRGEVKSGQLKEGLQTHAHVIVSRKDKTMAKSLSPNAKSRGKSDKHQLNGKSVKVGFDHTEFKVNAEKVFDRQFNYNRELHEKAAYRMLKKDPFKALGIKEAYYAYTGVKSKFTKVNQVMNPNALEFFSKQLGHKTIENILNIHPAAKAAYKAVRLLIRGLEMGM